MTNQLRRLGPKSKAESRQKLTDLLHHLSVELLWASYHALKRTAGVDTISFALRTEGSIFRAPWRSARVGELEILIGSLLP